MEALANEYQAMIENERRRHEFVEVQAPIIAVPLLCLLPQNLMQTIQSLTAEKDEALRKYNRVDVTCNAYQTRLETAEKKIDELQKAIVCSPSPEHGHLLTWATQDCDRFVLVLIDGDNTLVRCTP